MINEAGIRLIKEFEGCKLKAYLDTLADPPVWTVGWGDTGPHVREGTVITQEEADERLLRRANGEFAQGVLDLCVEEPNENQLAALTSFAYNLGLGALKKSTLLRKHNAGDFIGAANEFKRWNKSGGKVVAGLTRRRSAESALYLTPPDDRPQRTRIAADEPASKSVGIPATVATVGATLTGVQQVVANVEGIWNSFHEMGINPHYVMAGLGIAAVVTCGYFIYDAWKRKDD